MSSSNYVSTHTSDINVIGEISVGGKVFAIEKVRNAYVCKHIPDGAPVYRSKTIPTRAELEEVLGN